MSYRARGAAYKFTPKRKAALRKAQLISARKRRRNKIKKVAVGTGIVAGVGVGAYLGVKHQGTIKNGAARAKAAVQPFAKEATLIKHGLTKGFHKGAGPDAGQSNPHAGFRRVHIPTISKEEQQRLMDDAIPSASERGRRQADRQERKLKREAKTGQTQVRGVPSALIYGRKLSQRKAWGIITKASQHRATAGGEGFTQAQMVDILNQMIADGSVAKNMRGRRAKNNLKIPGITGKSPLTKRRHPQAPPRHAENYQDWVFDQLYKHGKLDF